MEEEYTSPWGEIVCDYLCDEDKFWRVDAWKKRELPEWFKAHCLPKTNEDWSYYLERTLGLTPDERKVLLHDLDTRHDLDKWLDVLATGPNIFPENIVLGFIETFGIESELTIEEEGKVIAYIDDLTGRVLYVNPDASRDEYVQKVVREKVEEIQTRHDGTTIDISDPQYAEALFDFCTDGESLDDRDRACMAESDLSFAEYVQKYKLKEFRRWYAVFYARLGKET